MDKSQETPLQLIAEVGAHLSTLSRPNKDSLVKSLRQAATGLSQIELSPEASRNVAAVKKVEGAVDPLRKFIVKHGLLRKNDRDIKLLLAICVSELFRITAPEPPFEDQYLRDIFKLILGTFAELGDTSSPYFPKRAKVLETVARCKCCVIMLDIDCNDLVPQMFNIFFSVVREHHQKSLVDDILSIMKYMLNEEASTALVDAILRNLVKEEKDASPASQLAVSIIQSCTEILEPLVCGFLTSCSLDKDSVHSELKEFYHEIVVKICKYAPQMLLPVIPNLTEELVTDQVDIRRKAVKLIGKLFALNEEYLGESYRYLFVEFKNRFCDKSPEVRLSAMQCSKAFYMANPFRKESREVLVALEERFLDLDDKVRAEAVVITCELAKTNLKIFPPELISKATERLRDKKMSVRKTALQKLMELYRDYCNKCAEGQITTTDHFEQIPCGMLMLCFEKDCKELKSQSMDVIIAEDLFPAVLSVEEMTRHWIHMFSLFTPFHVKALTIILSLKRRLQTEMQAYLTQRKKEKDSSSEETQKGIKKLFSKMSALFPDPSKAEECFHNLNQMRDNHIFNALELLLDDHSIKGSRKARDTFLKMVGNKHPHFEILVLLSSKCAFNIFCSEHARCIMDQLSTSDFGNEQLGASSAKLLLVITSIFPMLLRGSEEKLLMLLEKNPINDTLIEILGKGGPHISEKLSNFNAILEKICLDGTRIQSKHAVSAIALLGGSSEPAIFSNLCKKVVDSLRSGCNTPTLLQSLGCIAQYSVSAFEAQDEEIRSLLFERIFQEEALSDPNSSKNSDDCTYASKVKIYGLKMLVKSFLPRRGSHVKRQIDELFDILLKLLNNDDPFGGTILCETDKPHIRLAAAKSVLRLSGRWNLHISPEIFRHTIMMAKDSSSFVCRSFLDKTSKLLKTRSLPSKYACAFALSMSDRQKDIQVASFKYMEEFIKDYSREAQIRQTSTVEGGYATDYPAYVVVFLIHILAHDAGFPPDGCQDAEVYAQFCSPLFWFVQALLVNANLGNGSKDISTDVVNYLLGLLRAIKKAEDAVDAEQTPKLHILAEVGMSVVNQLSHNNSSLCAPRMVLLPSTLYKISPLKKCSEVNSKCSTQFSVSQGFLERVVDSLKSRVSMGEKTAHQDLRLGNRRKRALSPTASELGGLRDERSAIDLSKNHASGGSNSIPEKEQHSLSRDCASMKHAIAEPQVSNPFIDRVISSEKENAEPSSEYATQSTKISIGKGKESCSLSYNSCSDIRKGKATAHQDLRLGNKRKRALSPTASDLGGLQNECSAIHLCKNHASGGSSSALEKEQHSLSCDSASMKHTLAEPQVSNPDIDRGISSQNENAGSSSVLAKEPYSLSCDSGSMKHTLAEPQVSNPDIDRVVSSQKENGSSSEYTIQSTKFSIGKGKESCSLSYNSFNNNCKEILSAGDLNNLSSLQETVTIFGDDATKKPKRSANAQNQKFLSQEASYRAKEKKAVTVFSDSLVSEVININEDAPVATRTRRRLKA